MANIYPYAYQNEKVIPFERANLSIGSSAVLYGLSIYTVLYICKREKDIIGFRLSEHFKRLEDSAKIIGIGTPSNWNYEYFLEQIRKLCLENKVKEDVFVRISIHVDELVPGTRSRGVHTQLSMFIYSAEPIVPLEGARLKTSLWRRIPDNSIPSRAKVNGAYINSVLARQDAIDSGYDDCIFLDTHGHVCELSAANIFLVRDGVLITPDTHSDLLEGINRRTILQIARDENLKVQERSVDLTELYVADEVFMCGTSAFVTPVFEVDARTVGNKKVGPITNKLRKLHNGALTGTSANYASWITKLV